MSTARSGFSGLCAAREDGRLLYRRNVFNGEGGTSRLLVLRGTETDRYRDAETAEI